jgi:hypothetical protein
MTTWIRPSSVELRKSPRRSVCQPVMLLNPDGSMIGPSTMLDVSAGGARLRLAAEIVLPAEFVLLLSKYDRNATRRCAAAWRTESEIGVRFLGA